MTSILKRILRSRDAVLILALITGFALGEKLRPVSELSAYALAIVMVFSTTSLSVKHDFTWKKFLRDAAGSFILNYLVFSIIFMGFAEWFFPRNQYLSVWIGFLLIAIAPPGPSVIPFSSVLKGDIGFSVTGVLVNHLLAIVIVPLSLWFFLGTETINPLIIIFILLKIIVLPILIAQILRHKKTYPIVVKIRGDVVKWGLFLVIAPTMGMSKNIILSQPEWLIIITIAFAAIKLIGGTLHVLILKKLKMTRSYIVSSNLMLLTKSSAFAAVLAIQIFDGKGEILLPSAIISVLVTLYIIWFSWLTKKLIPES